MKLNNFTVSAVVAATAGASIIGESQATRDARIAKFWQDPKNAVLVEVGPMLAATANGKTYAAHIIAGEVLELETITIGTRTFPVAPAYQKIGLNVNGSKGSFVGHWACFACGSAHGSGVKPSKGVTEKSLMLNRFVYRPADQALFTISASCREVYVDKLGMAVHIVTVDALPAVPPTDKSKGKTEGKTATA